MRRQILRLVCAAIGHDPKPFFGSYKCSRCEQERKLEVRS